MLLYNCAAKNIFDAASGLKCVLLDSTYSPSPGHTTYSGELASFDVNNGAEWPSGGKDFESLITAIDGTDAGIITADNIQVTPATTQVGPFRFAVVMLADGNLLGWQDYGTDKIFPVGFTSGIGIVDGHIFKITA
jgi:hypothetical protein